MGAPSTLYRFRFELSDVDRAIYETLDFRIAMHPSETSPYLLTRVLAYALAYDPASEFPLEFNGAGLSDPDQPALKRASSRGGVSLWIEVGQAAARKLHKASKAADEVHVYTYRDPAALRREIEAERVHRAAEIRIVGFPSTFLSTLESRLERDNRWGLMIHENTLTVTMGEDVLQTEIRAV